MQILGVQNGSSGLECVSGDVDGGHAPTDDVVALKYPNVESGGGVVGRSIMSEELGDGGAADAASDYTHSGCCLGLGNRWRKDEEEKK